MTSLRHVRQIPIPMDETEYYNRRLGTTLRGKWTLESLLGAGGMAAVYVGVHHIGRRDAIKILHPEVAANPEVKARFEQEAHAVNRLQHPGAVQVRDFDVTEDGCPFLVMELLEGESLSKVLERGTVALPDLLRWTDELLEVLAAAHDLGIIHRDIKPDNLFIQTDGHLKVLDFGIARMREGAPKAMITRTGTALGTLSYMPPEQARGIHVDGRADLYSVGATLFRALARRRIHDGQSDADVLIKVATEQAPLLASVAPEVPAPVCSVVDCALSFDRDHRYPNARTMQSDVRALARNEIPPYVTANPPPARMDAAPASSAGPVSSGKGSDERTRAEGSTARRSQPLPVESTEPAPTRVEMKASPLAAAAAAPVPTLSYAAQMPPARVAVAAPVMAAASASVPPSASARRSGAALIVVAGVALLGVVLIVLLGIVGVLWLRSTTEDSATGAAMSAKSARGEPPEESEADGGSAEVMPTGTRSNPPATGTSPGTAAVPPGTGTTTLVVPPGTATTTAPPVATPPTAKTAAPPQTTPPVTTPPPATAPPGTTTGAKPPSTPPGKPPDKKKKHEK